MTQGEYTESRGYNIGSKKQWHDGYEDQTDRDGVLIAKRPDRLSRTREWAALGCSP